MKKIRYTVFGDSDIGRRRQENQDDFCYNNEAHLFAVADGMGGHEGGRRCAEQCIAWVSTEKVFVQEPHFLVYPTKKDALLLAERMSESMRELHHKMRLFAKDDERRPGSTLTVCRMIGPFLAMAHVGDSRLYSIVPGKAIEQLSTDHSAFGALLSAMGASSIEKLKVQYDAFEIQEGQTFLLCSDGLDKHVSDKTIEKVCGDCKGDVELFVKKLIELALERGGSDNVTCVAIHAQFMED